MRQELCKRAGAAMRRWLLFVKMRLGIFVRFGQKAQVKLQ